ncbi:hypothetical protein HNQ56_003433 [Anaerotaenia torta]|uniref:hypothetical protein n=1 Tax=Anaerotaenia torta TaxID=433293 RepID=UPI003D1ED268
MRKSTIFKYEMKRLFFSKEYLLLLVATLVYGISLLRSMVLYGTNYTAPFSQLTFSTYCSSLTPFLLILLLVLCRRQSLASELRAEAIVGATPMPLPVFRLLRCAAAACAFLVAAALPVSACFLFYRTVFGDMLFTAYPTLLPLLWTALLLLLPPAILLFGAAMLFRTRRRTAFSILLTVILVLGIFRLTLPDFIDILESSAVSVLVAEEYTLPGMYEFTYSSAFIASRIVFSFAGIVLTLLSLHPSGRKTAA